MPGQWFDASRDAESWDAERLQVGCLREIVVYNDNGGEFGTAFVKMTHVGKPNQHGAPCVVAYLGATRENFYCDWKLMFGSRFFTKRKTLSEGIYSALTH